MTEIRYSLPPGVGLDLDAREVIRKAKIEVFGDTPVAFVKDQPGPGVVGFGTVHAEAINCVGVRMLKVLPNAVWLVSRALRIAAFGPSANMIPFEGDPNKVLFFDIESHSVEERWSLPPHEFFRLGQYAWGPNGAVQRTTDLDEMLHHIRSASGVIGHNIHDFDLSVLFGVDSTEPLQMALDGKVFDTFVFANLAMPAPHGVYTRRDGRQAFADKPEAIASWLSLDNLAYQLSVPGKIGDLKDMAARYGGFCHIPLDDPEFLAYADQDVEVVRDVSMALVEIAGVTEYDWREQINAAIDAQNARNGFRVDVARATKRRDDLAARKEQILSELRDNHGFPATGKMPWRSTAGKEAVMSLLAAHGITPESRPDWKRSKKTGAVSLGGEELKRLAQGTAAEDVVDTLAEVMGQRTLPQLALDSVQPDGKAHPQITSLQRSGRKSTTKPGLTVWSARADGGADKAYFVPDSDDELLVEFDYSNADQRVVGAYSGDEVFMERVSEDFDGHEMSGRFLFGDETYDSDPKKYRQIAKPAGHGWAYRASAGAVMNGTGSTIDQARNFIEGMNNRYRGVVRWQDQMSQAGLSGALVNDWGRRMVVEPERAYTQAPALMGQNGTREIMVDSLIRMARHDLRLICWLKAQVHDALVFSIPKTDLDWAVPCIRELMEVEWKPADGGQAVFFPVGAGQPADDWQKAGH